MPSHRQINTLPLTEMAQDDLNWKTFFEENLKPSHFDENVKLISEVCQQSAIKKQRVALITVRCSWHVKYVINDLMNTFFLVWWNHSSSGAKYSPFH